MAPGFHFRIAENFGVKAMTFLNKTIVLTECIGWNWTITRHDSSSARCKLSLGSAASKSCERLLDQLLTVLRACHIRWNYDRFSSQYCLTLNQEVLLSRLPYLLNRVMVETHRRLHSCPDRADVDRQEKTQEPVELPL